MTGKESRVSASERALFDDRREHLKNLNEGTTDLTRTEVWAIRTIAYGMGFAYRNAETPEVWTTGRDLLNWGEDYAMLMDTLWTDRPEIYAALQKVHDASNEGHAFMDAYGELCSLLARRCQGLA
jgi:hypothetical protein